jgi:uncharacterized protein YciI
MAMYLVVRTRSGPEWDASRPMEHQSGWSAHASFMDRLVESGFVVLAGPLSDGHRVALAVQAESQGAVEATLADDPWSGSHLETVSIEAWTIRLDGRR